MRYMARQDQQQNLAFIPESVTIESGIPNVVATPRVVRTQPPRQPRAALSKMRTKGTAAVPNVYNPAPEIGIYRDPDLTYRSQDL